MNIEYDNLKARCGLKAVKYSAFASEETHCYQAKLYFDGKHILNVSNSGHGGGDYQHLVEGGEKEWARLDALTKALKPYKYCERKDGSTFELTYDVEHICGDLMNDWHRDRDIKRVLKKDRVVFLPEGTFDGGNISYFRFNRGNAAARERTVARIKHEHPKAKILTGLPMEELRSLWGSV